MLRYLFLLFVLIIFSSFGNAQNISSKIETLSKNLESKVIDWRHDLHQNPELSNREFNTAKKIEKHLKSLGIKVQTGVAHTGVVGILEGGKKGKVVALRADIDALPVTERVDIPFASKVKSEYNGKETGVMHACGHDTHVAILMGVAELLTKMKSEIKGTVKFIFQPAEEGAPKGEEGGAEMMVKEGVLENPKVDAIFGLHISSGLPVNHIAYKPGGALAAAQTFTIDIEGKQAHGSTPWNSVDAVYVASQIVIGLQGIISRESELTKEAAVITVGYINAGIRSNIIPETAKLIGTIRTLDYDMQKFINKRIKEVAIGIAKTNRAVAKVDIPKGYPITYNHIELTEQMLPTLQQVAGTSNVHLSRARTGAEDFSFFQEKIPGFFFFLGGLPEGKDPKEAPSHHTPDFYVDDTGMLLGIRSLSNLVFDYLDK